MKRLILLIFSLLLFIGCDNEIEFTSPEIKVLRQVSNVLKVADTNTKQRKKKIITRESVNRASNPILFFEKSDGLTGTLALFPGQNLEETWYSSDGVTISLFNGELIATRGLGNDVMNTIIPRSTFYDERLSSTYLKTINFLTSDNKIQNISLNCTMSRSNDVKSIEIYEIIHQISKFIELCSNEEYSIENKLWQDLEGNTLKSVQWHSKTHGYISFTRLN